VHCATGIIIRQNLAQQASGKYSYRAIQNEIYEIQRENENYRIFIIIIMVIMKMNTAPSDETLWMVGSLVHYRLETAISLSHLLTQIVGFIILIILIARGSMSRLAAHGGEVGTTSCGSCDKPAAFLAFISLACTRS
jgi:hypothetical protein